jgi:acyl carrier protein
VEALGARVFALAGDVADVASLSAALARLAAEAPPLAGVVHAAAHLGAARLEALEAGEADAMLQVDGTVLLERLCRARPLDFLVLFSSTTALLGASGLAHYAAANGFLDAFAHAARRRGVRAVSVNWGTWEVMRLADAERRRSYRDAGLEPMPAAEALELLGRAAAGDAAQLTVARIDWGVLRPLHEARRARPFLSRLRGVEPARPAAPAAEGPSLPALLAACAPAVRQDALVEFVRGEVAAVLAAPEPGAIGPDAGLFELGMDSLMSVELRRRLERAAGRSLPATLTFNYPNARALAGFLHAALADDGRAPAPAGRALPAPAPAPAPREALAALSDEELEARLRARLERNR